MCKWPLTIAIARSKWTTTSTTTRYGIMIIIAMVMVIVGIAAAGQAAAEVAREREPAAVSESQGWESCWRSAQGHELPGALGLGRGRGCGSTKDRMYTHLAASRPNQPETAWRIVMVMVVMVP